MDTIVTQKKDSGRFITVEGIDGAGKTTVTETIVSAIQKAGITVISTREPGGTAVGEDLRDLFLCCDIEIGFKTEVLILFAARAQHMEELILPELQAGNWVVSDRFTDSTYAYQGGGGEIPIEKIQQIENWVQGEFRPDLTILLDVDTDAFVERVLKNEKDLDRIENQIREFHDRVRSTYLEIAKREPKRVKRIDADQSIEQVSREARRIIQKFIGDCVEKPA